uniref:Uncharacterized protein n=1 Tax=Megaselia scalaris TaxID=36166 RepID=T1GC88_MEGSC
MKSANISKAAIVAKKFRANRIAWPTVGHVRHILPICAEHSSVMKQFDVKIVFLIMYGRSLIDIQRVTQNLVYPLISQIFGLRCTTRGHYPIPVTCLVGDTPAENKLISMA